MIWLIGILACGDKAKDSGTDPVEATPIDATLMLLSVNSGSPVPDISVSSGDSTDITGDDGRATVAVSSNSNYTLRTASDDAMDPLYQGTAGDEAFEVVGLLVSRRATESVFGAMNVSQSADKGIVVAALDKPDLTPAGGASAVLNSSSEGAFIFGSDGMPASGNVIDEVGSSFVYFPNVEPGNQTLEAIGSDGTTCNAFPAGDPVYTVNVEADAVSIVVFTCE